MGLINSALHIHQFSYSKLFIFTISKFENNPECYSQNNTIVIITGLLIITMVLQ